MVCRWRILSLNGRSKDKYLKWRKQSSWSLAHDAITPQTLGWSTAQILQKVDSAAHTPSLCLSGFISSPWRPVQIPTLLPTLMLMRNPWGRTVEQGRGGGLARGPLRGRWLVEASTDSLPPAQFPGTCHLPGASEPWLCGWFFYS